MAQDGSELGDSPADDGPLNGDELNNDELLRRVQLGDEHAFATLAARLHERLFRLAWRMLRDAVSAEEVATESLYKVWAKSRSWNAESTAGTWIYQLTVRTALDHRRRRRRWRSRWKGSVDPETPDRQPGPATELEQADEQQRRSSLIDAALAELSTDDRALVHLFYYEGMSLAEIEPVLSVNRHALKMRLSRARQRLKKLLNDYEFDQ